MSRFISHWTPPADIYYSGDQWLVKVELAGIAPDEVEIDARDATLVIRGKRRDMQLRKGYACHSMEISYSNFERSFALPARIIGDSIRWNYEQGILLVTFSTEAREAL